MNRVQKQERSQPVGRYGRGCRLQPNNTNSIYSI